MARGGSLVRAHDYSTTVLQYYSTAGSRFVTIGRSHLLYLCSLSRPLRRAQQAHLGP